MFGLRKKRAPVEGPFYKQRGWVNAVLFLAVLLVLSAVGLVTGEDVKDSSAYSREAFSGVSGPLSPGDPLKVRSGSDGRPEKCRTDDKKQQRPKKAPSDVEWRQRVAVMVPVSASAGPLRTEDNVMWWCFAHTPTGAVLAAHLIPVQLSGAEWHSVAEQQIVPGERRDTFVANKVQAEEKKDSQSPEPGAVGRFVGFSLDSYSSDEATVRLLLTHPIGGYLSTSVSLRWRDGDWKLALRTDGSLTSRAETAMTDGFTMWGAIHEPSR
ncbi:hypothetical protein [Streptomyces daliensis]|uniref:DUF8175 domain-containing protein n=1 Tax=Streptomyces daliensis TaxID=299421 RepID=A0A8T4IQK7_9ACTN|nr:hypothetical protein [Streptomyces daliensis]